MPVQAPSLQSMLKRKVPDPSTKNGRRSGKNVSKASRLTTAGSASTWPKSGFTVVVNVHRSRVDLAERVRHEFKTLRRTGHAQPLQLTELRDEAVGVARQ